MPHLADAIENVSTTELLCELRKTQSVLANRCRNAFLAVAAAGIDDSWGTRAKRTQVCLGEIADRGLISQEMQRHNLIECINQLATIERLIDCLLSLPDSLLFEFNYVVACHPTTSSARGSNDLVLRNRNGETARFEISDVCGECDGNKKEFRDLCSLGVLSKDQSCGCSSTFPWPSARLFLVTSTEFARGIMRRQPYWRKLGHCEYQQVADTKATSIIEILQGNARKFR